MKDSIKWIFIFILLCAVCAAIYLIMGNKDYKTAEIMSEGKVIRRIDLSAQNEEFTVECSGGGKNTIRAENGKIAVIDADCPDKICVNQGYIDSGAVPIVCLPHKLVISVKSAEEEYDAVSGGR